MTLLSNIQLMSTRCKNQKDVQDARCQGFLRTHRMLIKCMNNHKRCSKDWMSILTTIHKSQKYEKKTYLRANSVC